MKSLRHVALALMFVACRTPEGTTTVKEAPTGDNSPHWWGLDTMVYDDLPTQFSLPNVPWPSDYWATFRGGIAHRWQKPINSENYKKFLYAIPTAAQVAAMTEAEIDKLSPAEKYDLWLGRTDLKAETSATGQQRTFMLNAAQFNVDNFGKDEIPTWTGICNGWSLAAINEPYPRKPVKVTSPAGKKITFYPADIQALASQIYFDYQPGINVARLGTMCDEAEPAKNSKGRVISPICRDTNPMSFHLAIGRFLSQGKPFVFDVEPAEETWNQPAYGYDLTFANKRPKPASYAHAAPGTTQLVDVKVVFHYVKEAEVGKVGLTDEQMKEFVHDANYNYTLELDDQGKLLGGEWKKNSDIPDFLWKPDEMPSDSILKSLDPSYPLSYDKVKELITAASAP